MRRSLVRDREREHHGPPPPVLLEHIAEAARRTLHPDARTTVPGLQGLQSLAGNHAARQAVTVQRNRAVAATVAKRVKENGGLPPEGYEGGRIFENREGRLPAKDKQGKALTYWEYDVYPLSDDRGRGAVRVVIDSNWVAWYTSNHYRTFSVLHY